MSLLDKLCPTRRNVRKIVGDRATSDVATEEARRKATSCLGTEQVRILLFQECEWRGRKLLFDSLRVDNHRCEKEASASKKGKTAEDGTNSLSEMVFGTVAMTYKGPSFKVHSMNSPPCIMCTKVFPATVHNSCKQSERHSDETLTRSTNVESSNSSLQTHLSRPSSENLSSHDLCPCPRKNSTCSSSGSGWDIDVSSPLGSSQSFESNGSSSGVGSLSSLRRRWLRAVSTSLIRTDSDDVLGIQHYGDNGSNTGDKHYRTRLGLMILVRLTNGNERKVETRLLEHMTLLEGMLDRLRYFCIESRGGKGQCRYKGIQLADRMYRASYRIVVSLLRLLMDVNNFRTPLLWHDILLNSMITLKVNSNTLNRALQQMCQLLDDVDTKSTNFFLSTVVTAVLMYHLGWVYTILPSRDRRMMEKLGRSYPCNPLWAQLGDLHGAIGSPTKVTHTVVVGDSRKTDLINSVLSFLSYFIRSGIIQKQREYRCTIQQDLQEATNILEQMRINRPYLFNYSKPKSNDSSNLVTRRESQTIILQRHSPTQMNVTDYEVVDCNARRCSSLENRFQRPTNAEGSVPTLKRSDTMRSNLDQCNSKSSQLAMELKSKLSMEPFYESKSSEQFTSVGDEDNFVPSKVKIIVSEDASQEQRDPKDNLGQPLFSLEDVDQKMDTYNADETFATTKPNNLEEHPKSNADTFKLYRTSSDYQSSPDNVLSDDSKHAQVYFTLGCEEKSAKCLPESRVNYNCQCSYMFTRVPSTSAQLPEDVLRKIIQRNFPESSKCMQPPPETVSSVNSKSMNVCLRCRSQGHASSPDYKDTKQLLETPTNATEVLRICGSNVDGRTVGMSRSNSLEALMEANDVIELPMPRSKRAFMDRNDLSEDVGFTRTLLQTKVPNKQANAGNVVDSSYTWGLVVQGLIKKDRKKRRGKNEREHAEQSDTAETEKDWWYCMREEVTADVRFPTIDQPISEAICILADLDTWHVGIFSNNTPLESPPLTIGMSRLVSNMLEAFTYMWRKYHSPVHCIDILESKLREMWLRSEALASMLMAADVCDVSIAGLTNALDLDAADIPLLLAVATTHSPEIAQRFGLTLA